MVIHHHHHPSNIAILISWTHRGDEGVNSENEEHTKEAMKEDVIDFIEDMVETLSEENNTTTWPNLRAINLNTSRLQFSDLWPEDNDETFVVVERPDSYVGKEVTSVHDNPDHSDTSGNSWHLEAGEAAGGGGEDDGGAGR